MQPGPGVQWRNAMPVPLEEKEPDLRRRRRQAQLAQLAEDTPREDGEKLGHYSLEDILKGDSRGFKHQIKLVNEEGGPGKVASQSVHVMRSRRTRKHPKHEKKNEIIYGLLRENKTDLVKDKRDTAHQIEEELSLTQERKRRSRLPSKPSIPGKRNDTSFKTAELSKAYRHMDNMGSSMAKLANRELVKTHQSYDTTRDGNKDTRPMSSLKTLPKRSEYSDSKEWWRDGHRIEDWEQHNRMVVVRKDETDSKMGDRKKGVANVHTIFPHGAEMFTTLKSKKEQPILKNNPLKAKGRWDNSFLAHEISENKLLVRLARESLKTLGDNIGEPGNSLVENDNDSVEEENDDDDGENPFAAHYNPLAVTQDLALKQMQRRLENIVHPPPPPPARESVLMQKLKIAKEQIERSIKKGNVSSRRMHLKHIGKVPTGPGDSFGYSSGEGGNDVGGYEAAIDSIDGDGPSGEGKGGVEVGEIGSSVGGGDDVADSMKSLEGKVDEVQSMLRSAEGPSRQQYNQALLAERLSQDVNDPANQFLV